MTENTASRAAVGDRHSLSLFVIRSSLLVIRHSLFVICYSLVSSPNPTDLIYNKRNRILKLTSDERTLTKVTWHYKEAMHSNVIVARLVF